MAPYFLKLVFNFSILFHTTYEITCAQEGLGQAPMIKPVNPFVTNPHGHPSYAPAKLGSKGVGFLDVCDLI